jgi:hypothetical protein
LKNFKEEDRYALLNKIGNFFTREKEQLLLIWFLCESDILFDKGGKSNEFITKVEEGMD